MFFCVFIEELLSQLDDGVETLNKTKEQLKVYRQAVLKESFSKINKRVILEQITDSRLGKMLDKEKNTGIPRKYLRNVNVRWLKFDLSDLLEMKIEESEVKKYTVEKNDLVICEGGEPGRCAVWEEDEPMFYQKALHRVRFIAPKVLNKDNENELRIGINELNKTYKSFKYYFDNEDNLILDCCILLNEIEKEGNLIYTMFDVIIKHLNNEYKNLMQLIWK